MKIRYLSLFSGIGGFELGIQQAYENLSTQKAEERTRQEDEETLRSQKSKSNNEGDKGLGAGDAGLLKHPYWSTTGQPYCIGFSEIDKYATQIYQKHFPNHKNYGDITKINADTLPDFDLLVGGFPCQAFSIAGKRGGFNDTRGTLFFEIARILSAKRPKLFLLENVKGLLSHDGGRTFTIIIATLDELGYDIQWQVLNSKNFGVPQNRERVFIVGHLRGEPRPQVFPVGEADGNFIEQLNNPTHSNDRIYGTNGISPTLNTAQGGNRQPFIVAQRGRYTQNPTSRVVGLPTKQMIEPNLNGTSNTLSTVQKDNMLLQNAKIRRLTPLECERLMGYPDGWTEGLSDTQRYKTLGNGVVSNVVEEIVRKLM